MIPAVLSAFALLLSSAAAAPARAIIKRSIPPTIAGDAPYTQDEPTYLNAITCVNFQGNKAGGVVLLVHGTGSTGSQSWQNGPYAQYLPSKGKTYDVCWVDLPSRSLGDAQLNAEYVAYAIGNLYERGGNKQIAIIGHSQGAGINPQWALTFWPSKRPLVRQYIGLAADWKGTSTLPVARGVQDGRQKLTSLTAEIALFCAGSTAVGGCTPSLRQQSNPSNYLAAQNSKIDKDAGGRALVPTSGIYTYTDDIIQPEIGPSISTALDGATIYAVQDLRVCGPTHVADHFSMVVDPAAFGLAFNSLETNTPINPATLNKAYCDYFVDDVLLNFTSTASLLRAIFDDLLSVATYPKTETEPPLQPYVCERGYAANCAASSGFPSNYYRA